MDLVNQLEQRMTFTDFCNRDPIQNLPCDGGVRSYLNTTQPTFDLQWIAPKRMFMWVVSVVNYFHLHKEKRQRYYIIENCAAKKYSLEGDYVVKILFNASAQTLTALNFLINGEVILVFKVDMAISFEAVNPGGEYLSLNQVPYKPL